MTMTMTMTMTMMLFKILAALLLLAGFAPRATLGLHISDTCLVNICSRKVDTCPPPATAVMNQPSSAAERLTVDPGELDVINSLLSLRPVDERTFNCSATDVIKYRKLITCDCPCDGLIGLCRVTGINFSKMNLKGGLPDKGFENLKYLKNLDLSRNRLSGLIPGSLTNLVRIEYINLCRNHLAGPIPPFDLWNTELKGLYLCENLLNGSIPRELGELVSLEDLFLNQNNFTGPIPPEFWNVKSLTKLRLQDNQFNGSIPEQVTDLNNLQQLLLMNNNFSGELLENFGKMSKMRILKIQGNNFNGTVPVGLDQLSKLVTLWLLGNNFMGPLPTTFSSNHLTDIAISDIGIFCLNVTNRFPELGNFVHLKSLTLRNCSLSGEIPVAIWSLPNLTYLDLSFNNLFGQLPPNLGRKLNTIYLRRNKFEESLPEWVNNAALSIDLSDNRFSAPAALIPPNPNNTNLVFCCSNTNDGWLDVDYACKKDAPTNDHLYINCGGNVETLDDNKYEADVNPNGGSSFFLSRDSTWGYSSMGKTLFPGNSNYTYIANESCNIPGDAPIYTSARTSPISLKYYGFCLKNGDYIVRLHFAEIGWCTEPIFVAGKRVFDVEIQGKKELKDFNIESEAKGIYKNITKDFHATVNSSRLEIHFYWSGMGSMTVPHNYGPLISAISVFPDPKDQDKLPKQIIGAIVGSSVVFVALLLALSWKLSSLVGKKPKKDGVELYPGGFYKFEQIRDATNNFSPKNQIGVSGNVYKGILKDARAAKQMDEMESKLSDESVGIHKDVTEGKHKDEIIIAVKKLSAKTKEGVIKILQEIGLVYTLEHPNIAKPMGCCTKDRQVLIVYKYMENVSLQNALFGSDEVKSQLNWQTRCKICLGLAKGLAFLHEESQLDFNVKISDFGYTELHDEGVIEQGTLHTPRAKDTGHMAPEYMQGRPLTPKSDIYSFGLVALEIISGQPHIMVKTKEDIHLINTAYTCYAEDNLEALIDGSLSSHADYKHNEAVNMLHLAMECVSPGFDLRPNMFEVVQVLEGKKKLSKKNNPCYGHS